MKVKKAVSFLKRNRMLDGVEGIFYTNPVLLASGGCGACDNCFIEDSKVLVAEGHYKKIQEMKEGDSLISFDTNKKNHIIQKVARLQSFIKESTAIIILNDTLITTGNHRLWVNNTSWERVDSLKINDFLLDVDGNKVIITKMEKKEGSFNLYNLYIKGEGINEHLHNYFVENILVHENN